MGHDIFVYGASSEDETEDEYDSENESFAPTIAYLRFGAGYPFCRRWYYICEAETFDNGCSGNGECKIIKRSEFKAYKARYLSLKPFALGQSPPERARSLRLGSLHVVDDRLFGTTWKDYHYKKIDDAIENMENFFNDNLPRIASPVALFLANAVMLPKEAHKIIAHFAADEMAFLHVLFT